MFGNRPGSFFVKQITLINQDQEAINIQSICPDLKIYEGIQQEFLKGKLTVVDGIGMLKNYKLVGQESLTIEVDTENASFKKTFRVYAIDNVFGDPVKKSQTYRLMFCDPKLITCQTKRLSKTVRGSYSSMLLEVLQEDANFKFQKDINDTTDYWEETEPTNLQIVCPNWTIEKFIKVCVSNSSRKSKDNSYKQSMFFYQTLNGGFRFASFETMVKELEEPVIFDMGIRNDIQNAEFNDDTGLIGQGTQILGTIQPQRADVLTGYQMGAYASKQITYDPIRKLEEDNIYKITDSFKNDKQNHTSKFPLINTEDMEVIYESSRSTFGDLKLDEKFIDLKPTDKFESFIKYSVNPTNAFSDEPKLIDTNSESIKTQQLGIEKRDTGDLERTAMLANFSQNNTLVTIPFRTDINCGTTVRLKFPPFAPQDDEDDRDLMQDDRYLITHVRYHMLPADNEGTVTLTCAKDSFAKDVKTHKPMSSMKNPVIEV